MTDQTKKNRIQSSVLLKAITATQEEFQSKSDEYNKLGIRRIDTSSLVSEYNIIEKKEHRGIIISNAEIDMSSRIFSIKDFKDQYLPAIIFDNCTIRILYISNSILLSSNNSYTNIYFLSSQVEQIKIDNNSNIGTLEFRNSQSNHSLNISNGSKIEGIRILNESILKQINIHQKSQTSDILITGKSEITHVITIDDSTIGNVNIESSSKAGRFTLKNQSTAGWFNINGGSQTEDIKVRNSEIKTFNLRDNSKIGDFEILDKSKTDWIKIYEQSKTGNIIISNESQTGNIDITRSTIDSFTAISIIASIFVNSSIIEFIKIEDSYIPSLQFKDQSKTEAYIHNCQINLIDFNHSIVSQDTSLSFSSSQIYCCLMEQLSVLGSLYFRDVKALTEPFNLPDRATPERSDIYKKHKEIELAKTYGINQSLFLVTYSSLGKTEFIDSDLQSFSEFEFAHSHIKNIFVSGLRAPSKNLKIKGLEEKSVEWYEQMVSFYSQFSSVFEEQGFIYNAVKFRSKSAYLQQKQLEKNWKQNFGELLPFWLNYISNNHGESWTRALLFIFVSTILLYGAYLDSLGLSHLPDAVINWPFDGYYFEFINPFRPIDFMQNFNNCTNTSIKFFDFLSRVVIGYGFYQFLTAFRKYKKK